MKRGSSVGRERLLWEREASALVQATAHVHSTRTILHTASRIEAHDKTGADLCPMGESDQPSTSATGRFIVLQYSGARRSAREDALDLCSTLAATDDAETTRAAACQAQAEAQSSRRPGHNWSSKRSRTAGVLRDGREAIHQAGCHVFTRQEELNHLRLMAAFSSNASMR